jgi:hypothetical protein
MGIGSTGAKDLQASPTPNASVSVNYQCTDASTDAVGSTGAQDSFWSQDMLYE